MLDIWVETNSWYGLSKEDTGMTASREVTQLQKDKQQALAITPSADSLSLPPTLFAIIMYHYYIVWGSL